MEKLLKDRINLTIENYRNAKEDLRNDGDLINHFASLVFTSAHVRGAAVLRG